MREPLRHVSKTNFKTLTNNDVDHEGKQYLTHDDTGIERACSCAESLQDRTAGPWPNVPRPLHDGFVPSTWAR